MLPKYSETWQLYWRIDYKISKGLTCTWEMFRGYLPRNFLMILALLLLVLWIATKFTFTTITLEEDNIALHGKNNMQHLHTPTWNWCTYWDNVRRHHCIMWEKIISIICIYLPETLPKVPFLSLNFCLSKQEFGCLNNLKHLNE